MKKTCVGEKNCSWKILGKIQIRKRGWKKNSADEKNFYRKIGIEICMSKNG